MDKRVIFAVAGSGKTTKIVRGLNLSQRFLIVTYTTVNKENIRKKILQTFKYFPENVRLYTYFEFLYGFCYKPFLSSKFHAKGLTFCEAPRCKPGLLRYMNSKGLLYSNRLAKFIDCCSATEKIVARIEKYFDFFFLDEVQDIAGHDFNLLIKLSCANVNILLVGDFYQHTFDTSRDGNVNRTLYDDYQNYRRRFEDAGFTIDDESLVKSHRCSTSVCEFITTKIGIKIESSNDNSTRVQFLSSPDELKAIYEDTSIVKLFFKQHYKYSCHSLNWGSSKGKDCFNDVCVVLNQNSAKHFVEGRLNYLPPTTRNKLYVACSRARGNLFFIKQADLDQLIPRPHT